ncbi:MAG TPA: hypothetical protein VJP88_06505 [Caulobacteraceae bacterium]|nr:hypothetical protein [Caulobacteraceae bacterium]
MLSNDTEKRLAVQEALVAALITHAANRGMIADMIHEAKVRLGYPMSAEEKSIRVGVLAQLEAVLRQLDMRPIALRR